MQGFRLSLAGTFPVTQVTSSHRSALLEDLPEHLRELVDVPVHVAVPVVEIAAVSDKLLDGLQVAARLIEHALAGPRTRGSQVDGLLPSGRFGQAAPN